MVVLSERAGEEKATVPGCVSLVVHHALRGIPATIITVIYLKKNCEINPEIFCAEGASQQRWSLQVYITHNALQQCISCKNIHSWFVGVNVRKMIYQQRCAYQRRKILIH